MSTTFEDIKRDALNVIQHHGIKGQKWGVRRTPEQLGHDEPVAYDKKKRVVVGKQTAKTNFIKNAPRNPQNPNLPRDPKELRAMSNEEFEKIIKRLQLEETYDKIINKDYNDAAAAREKTKQFWADKRNQIIGNTVTSAVQWLVNTGGQLATQAINAEIRNTNEQRKAAAGG